MTTSTTPTIPRRRTKPRLNRRGRHRQTLQQSTLLSPMMTMPRPTQMVIATLLIVLQLLPTASGFANYMLTESNCLMDLDPSEVIMNHPVEKIAANDDPPLRLHIDGLPPSWKVMETFLTDNELDDIEDLDPPPLRPIVIPNDEDGLTFPLSLKVSVQTTREDRATDDYQYVLQLYVPEGMDGKNIVSFENGACDGNVRVVGRESDTATLVLAQRPPAKISLWAGWAAGHEAVKLLHGFQLQFMAESSLENNNNNQNEQHSKDEEKAKTKSNWVEQVVSEKACQSEELTVHDDKTITVQSADEPFPKELVVVKERDEESAAIVEIDLGSATRQQRQDQIGTVVFHVTTFSSDEKQQKLQQGDSTTAHWVSDNTACPGQERLVVRQHEGEELPAILQIPTLNEEHVTIRIQATYEVEDENKKRLHNGITTLLYKTEPLELHWSTSQQQEQRQELERQEREEEATSGDEGKLDDIRSQLLQKHAELKQKQREKDGYEYTKMDNNHDPQRDLDKKISQDLRAHLKELQQKEQYRGRQQLERDALKEKYRSNNRNENHGRRDNIDERRDLQDRAHRHRDPLAAQSMDMPKQEHDERRRRRESEDRNQETVRENRQKPAKYRSSSSSRDDDGGDDDNVSSNVSKEEIPVVLWQDSSYFMGLLILVGGIYGTILLMPFLSKLVATKGRRE